MSDKGDLVGGGSASADWLDELLCEPMPERPGSRFTKRVSANVRAYRWFRRLTLAACGAAGLGVAGALGVDPGRDIAVVSSWFERLVPALSMPSELAGDPMLLAFALTAGLMLWVVREAA